MTTRDPGRRGRAAGRVRLLGVALVLLGVVGAGSVPGVGAQVADPGSFDLVARADVASLEVVDPAAPAVAGGQVIYATPATAQALVNDLGVSDGLASAPYPGELVVSIPGLVAGLTAGTGAPALPPYPFVAQSTYPVTPSQEVRQGPYLVSAKSSEFQTDAEARLGLLTVDPTAAASLGQAHATRHDDGSAEALALSETSGFGWGGIKFGDLTSTATVTVDAAGIVHKASTFELVGLSVLGVDVILTEQGLQAAGQALPGVDPAPLADLLAQAGVELAYVPARETDTSVTSAALRMVFNTPVPNHATVTTTVTFGAVTASARSTVPVGDGGGGSPVAEEPPPGNVGSSAPSPRLAGPVSGYDPSPAPFDLSAGFETIPGSEEPPVPEYAPAPAATAASRPATPASAGTGRGGLTALPASSPGPSARGFYPILVLAGVAVLAGGRVISELAVRQRLSRAGS